MRYKIDCLLFERVFYPALIVTRDTFIPISVLTETTRKSLHPSWILTRRTSSCPATPRSVRNRGKPSMLRFFCNIRTNKDVAPKERCIRRWMSGGSVPDGFARRGSHDAFSCSWPRAADIVGNEEDLVRR